MIFSLLAIVIALGVFHIFVFHQYNSPRTIKLINKIPGPEGVFYFGSTMRFWKLKSEERLDEISNMFKTFGSTYRYWFSGVPTVMISELEDYQTVLSSRLDNSKGIMYKHILPWLGRGLLTSSGYTWHVRRKMITPTFHFAILQNFVETFNRNTMLMMKRLDDVSDKSHVDLSSYITCCTLDNICETAMGASVNSQTSVLNKYATSVFRMGNIVAERVFSPILFPDVNFALSAIGREHKQLLTILHGFTNKVIDECKRVKSFTLPLNSQFAPKQNQGKLSFLELLLEKQNEYKLSDKDIREEVDTFMFEGHDTTSMGIIWTLFELGHHPEIQEKCFTELKSIFGNSDRAPTYQDLKEMSYLKRVVKESLRLHPSVPVISRKFDVDLQLKDYLIPKGSEIVMCIYSLHRNPQVYPEPEKFDPDRFLENAVTGRHSFAYLPFSAGLRNCVGQKFAMMELLLVTSSVLRKFKLETLGSRDTVKSVPELTLRPFEPINWKITSRSHSN